MDHVAKDQCTSNSFISLHTCTSCLISSLFRKAVVFDDCRQSNCVMQTSGPSSDSGDKHGSDMLGKLRVAGCATETVLFVPLPRILITALVVFSSSWSLLWFLCDLHHAWILATGCSASTRDHLMLQRSSCLLDLFLLLDVLFFSFALILDCSSWLQLLAVLCIISSAIF